MKATTAEPLLDKRTHNFFALIVGPVGHGKSSLACELTEERMRLGRYALVQDTNRDFERLCERHESPGAWAASAMQAHKEKRPAPLGVGLACPQGADELLELAKALGQRLNQLPGAISVPLVVTVNEASSFRESGRTWIGELQNYVVSQRRHLGVELIYCLQDPSQLPLPFWEQITEVHLFAMYREDRRRQLEQRLGLERGELELLARLEPRQYVTWTPRLGDRGGLDATIRITRPLERSGQSSAYKRLVPDELAEAISDMAGGLSPGGIAEASPTGPGILSAALTMLVGLALRRAVAEIDTASLRAMGLPIPEGDGWIGHVVTHYRVAAERVEARYDLSVQIPYQDELEVVGGGFAAGVYLYLAMQQSRKRRDDGDRGDDATESAEGAPAAADAPPIQQGKLILAADAGGSIPMPWR